MDSTPNLRLPYLMAAQAQKHVTHNEALRALDVLVQLSVIDRTHAAAPTTPAEGDRYIVAAAATGAWAGQSDKIAAFQDGGWQFFAATGGWLAYVAVEGAIVAWTGTAWRLASSGGAGDNIDHIGINAAADTTNRLTVSSPSTLLNHAGAGHQLKINKSAAAQTASVLLQDGFSGRAEMGLAGDDNFHVKVSADGATWRESIVIDRATGAVSFPSGGGGSSGVITLLIGAGESNEGGLASNAAASLGELAPRASVQVFNNTTFNFETLRIGVNNLIGHAGLSNNATHGIENGLANTLDAGRWPISSLYLLKAGQGGSTIAQWAVGDASGYWNTFVSRFNAAKAILTGLGLTIAPVIFYTQGINDAIAGTSAATWQAATVAHFAKLRALVGASTPIVMTKFASPPFNAADAAYNSAMDAITAADSKTFVLDTAGTTVNADGNHLDYQGWLVTAERLVDRLQGGSGTLAAPTISLAAGSYTGTQSVTISGPAGSTIRYSLDGTPPTSHAAVYPGAIPIAATATLKAVALRLGWVNSPVTAAAYIIGAVQAAAPTFAPAAGAYSSVQSVALASATAGSTIFYTTDGSTPTTASPVYSTPIAVSASTTIKAIATASGFTTSAVASAAYTINGAAATPTFAPAAGSYSAAQSVAISSATAGASIYYTTDGSTPTTASTAYSSPISVAASETIKAIAVAAGYSNSAVGSAAYTITIPAGPTTTIVTWTAMTAASQSGNYLLNANATPSGGRAVQTIDATQAFRVTVENTGANSEGVVTYLDTTTGTDYNWSGSHSYLAGAFHYNGGLLRTTVGGASSGLGAIALPDLVSFVKSGNDVVLQTSADNGATWATVSTFTGVLAGQGTIYVKSLFAIGGTTKQIKISITV